MQRAGLSRASYHRRLPAGASIALLRSSARDAVDRALAPGLALTVAYATFSHGGFYPLEGIVVGGLAVLVGACALRREVARGALLPMLAFLLLAAGLAVGAVATASISGTVGPASTLAAMVGGFVVTRALLRRGDRATVLWIVAATGGAVAALGVAGLAFHIEPWGMFATWIWRAASTLSYANGAAAFLMLSLPAAVALVSTEPGDLRARLLAFVIALGAMATLSRGALLAGALAGSLLLVFGGRESFRGLARPLLGAVVAMVGLLPSVLGEAAHPIPALLALAVGVGIALAPTTRWRRSLAVGAVLLVSAAVVGAVIVKGSTLVRSRAGAEPRSALWAAALEAGRGQPVFGVGLGRFRTDATLFAHNEYLHVFAETGAVGLGSVAGAMVLFGAWVWARRRSADRALWALSVAAAAGFLAHSAVDFLWRFPALLLLVSMWLALAGEPAARTEGARR